MDIPYSSIDVGKRMAAVIASISPFATRHEGALYILERCAGTATHQSDVAHAVQSVLGCTADQAVFFCNSVRTKLLSDKDDKE